jgi:hypothetical protein
VWPAPCEAGVGHTSSNFQAAGGCINVGAKPLGKGEGFSVVIRASFNAKPCLCPGIDTFLEK